MKNRGSVFWCVALASPPARAVAGGGCLCCACRRPSLFPSSLPALALPPPPHTQLCWLLPQHTHHLPFPSPVPTPHSHTFVHRRLGPHRQHVARHDVRHRQRSHAHSARGGGRGGGEGGGGSGSREGGSAGRARGGGAAQGQRQHRRASTRTREGGGGCRQGAQGAHWKGGGEERRGGRKRNKGCEALSSVFFFCRRGFCLRQPRPHSCE